MVTLAGNETKEGKEECDPVEQKEGPSGRSQQDLPAAVPRVGIRGRCK